jgi:SAM-dependent methyltransferase
LYYEIDCLAAGRNARRSIRGIGRKVPFQCADILDYPAEVRFDIVTTARTLQWIADPGAVVQKMRTLLKPNGILCVLDYNHTHIEWDPLPPSSLLFFYDQFLRWRSDAGMDNNIGDHIGAIILSQNMKIIADSDQYEFREKEDPDFQTHVGIWSKVAQTRGKQLVTDGYLTEEQRVTAINEYTDWCNEKACSMRLHLKATHAVML